MPPVFLIVAAALVHLVLGRLVDGEREQIGLLKAFGYDDVSAATIYLKMAGSRRRDRRAGGRRSRRMAREDGRRGTCAVHAVSAAGLALLLDGVWRVGGAVGPGGDWRIAAWGPSRRAVESGGRDAAAHPHDIP